MNAFDKLTKILSFKGFPKGKSNAESIRDRLALFSSKHTKITRLLVESLKTLSTYKKRFVLTKELLTEKEDNVWINSRIVWKGETVAQKQALVRTKTKKYRRKIAVLNSKIEEYEGLRSAIYGSLKTLEQGRDSLSRQLSVLELEEKLER